MNKKQMCVLWPGIVLVAWMGLFPPWIYTYHSGSVHSEKSAGYSLILDPPSPERSSNNYGGVRLDVSRLAVQLVVVCFVTGGLIASLRGPANPINLSRGSFRVCIVVASLWSLFCFGMFIKYQNNPNPMPFLALAVFVAVGWVTIFGVWWIARWIARGFRAKETISN